VVAVVDIILSRNVIDSERGDWVPSEDFVDGCSKIRGTVEVPEVGKPFTPKNVVQGFLSFLLDLRV
jgi:hypothetical protein